MSRGFRFMTGPNYTNEETVGLDNTAGVLGVSVGFRPWFWCGVPLEVTRTSRLGYPMGS
jgi:hypothetical protein